MAFDGLTAAAGALVGLIVGVTGVGGGALMTPMLVLLFGVAPHIAIGTDLVYASITKMVGLFVHHQHGTVDWQVVRRLACGSLPAAALTLLWLTAGASRQRPDGAVTTALAVALLVTALGMLLKERLHGLGRAFRVAEPSRFKHLQPVLTVAAGVLLGGLVTWTSIGAGALGTVMLVYLYPLRMTASRLVGTDLAHAIPLALIAGLGHLAMGNVDGWLLVNLLAGSIPGVVVGAVISARAPLTVIRYAIAVTLTGVAIRLLAS